MGKDATRKLKVRGLVFPRWQAAQHPAVPMLREYATRGCPVKTWEAWTAEQLQAAVDKGPHSSALEDDAIAQIQVEARKKEAQGFSKIYIQVRGPQEGPPACTETLTPRHDSAQVQEVQGNYGHVVPAVGGGIDPFTNP